MRLPLGEVAVAVAVRDHLIAMKRTASRPHDLLDIAALMTGGQGS